MSGVTLHTRAVGAAGWTLSPAKLLGRRTYEAWLGGAMGSAEIAEYCVSAASGRNTLYAPLSAPAKGYRITLS